MSTENQPASWPFPPLFDCQDERRVPRRCRNPDCDLCYESPRDYVPEPLGALWLRRMIWGFAMGLGAGLWLTAVLAICQFIKAH